VPLPAHLAPGGVEGGLVVTALDPSGPAAAAQLQAGDIITEIDGQRATSTLQLTALELARRAGDTVTLTYRRGDDTGTAKLTLTNQP
jgi:putative serine protease PepD